VNQKSVLTVWISEKNLLSLSHFLGSSTHELVCIPIKLSIILTPLGGSLNQKDTLRTSLHIL
jgi:hypothetical protein